MPVQVVRHPIAQDALLALRDAGTPPARFRLLAHRLSLVLAIAATDDLPTAEATVSTPLEPAGGARLSTDVVVVPVLRAGLGMLDAVLQLLPHAMVGHIGLVRDETTAVASRYYGRLPAFSPTTVVLVVDPMLATGGSAIAACREVADAGARDVRLVSIVAAPEGVRALEAACPTVRVITAAVDRQLDPRKYILPGLGDFGDRLYGT